MTALLALTSAWGVPASRIAAPCASYGVVCVDKTRPAKRPAKSKILELCERIDFPQSQTSPSFAADEFPIPISALDQSLFQRPPPPRSL
jgi:hypothetical protein